MWLSCELVEKVKCWKSFSTIKKWTSFNVYSFQQLGGCCWCHTKIYTVFFIIKTRNSKHVFLSHDRTLIFMSICLKVMWSQLFQSCAFVCLSSWCSFLFVFVLILCLDYDCYDWSKFTVQEKLLAHSSSCLSQLLPWTFAPVWRDYAAAVSIIQVIRPMS